MDLYSVHLTGFSHSADTFRGSLIVQGVDVDEVDRLVDSVPCVLKSGESRAEAEKLKRFYEAAGGVVEIRGGDVVEVESGPSSDPFALSPPPAGRDAAPEPLEPPLDLREPAPAAAPTSTPPYCPRCDLGPLAADATGCKRCGLGFGATIATAAEVLPPPVTPRAPAARPRTDWKAEGKKSRLARAVGFVLCAGALWLGISKFIDGRNRIRPGTPVAAGQLEVPGLRLTLEMPEHWRIYPGKSDHRQAGFSARQELYYRGDDPELPDEMMMVGVFDGPDLDFDSIAHGGSLAGWIKDTFSNALLENERSGRSIALELHACEPAQLRDNAAYDCPGQVNMGDESMPARFFIWEEDGRLPVLFYATADGEAAREGARRFVRSIQLGVARGSVARDDVGSPSPDERFNN